MQFITTSSGIKSEKKPVLAKKPLVSFYHDPPTEELTLDEFEILSLDRLQLLRAIENLKAKQFEEKEFNEKLRMVSRSSSSSISSVVYCKLL